MAELASVEQGVQCGWAMNDYVGGTDDDCTEVVFLEDDDTDDECT
jgi:hypothetical protein